MSTASIGDRVRSLRKGAKLTQEQLARDVGVVSMTISRIERNEQEPEKSTLDALALRFKVSPAFISFGIEESRVTYDRDVAIDAAADSAGLDDVLRERLYTACRSIGPMSPGELLQTAERIARNAKTSGLAHPKNVDRTEVDPKRDRGNLRGYKG